MLHGLCFSTKTPSFFLRTVFFFFFFFFPPPLRLCWGRSLGLAQQGKGRTPVCGRAIGREGVYGVPKSGTDGQEFSECNRCPSSLQLNTPSAPNLHVVYVCMISFCLHVFFVP
eukprot:NODE_5653_length_496_cov_30.442953_g4226_i0.p1 GENE.NODE_5653_length_496_cov_30.442953_g4226_i0~~NODE_5653_length_496_cov_30.442953_g4226_i0.p1  ORF type:complete len:113 (-),score=24.64 NODE_5653_length_496_cov_30.442953_g4226_i0:32-370(-)